jgi:uncharacterized protein YutD
MNLASHSWVSVNNSAMQTVGSIGTIVVGLLLTIGARQTEDSSIGTISAFLLGLLLLAVGMGTLIFGGKQTVTVDAKAQRITLEHKNRFRTSLKHIRFHEIVDGCVDEIGDKEGGSISYYVLLKLKSGKEVQLFKGFFDDSYNKSAMEARCQRLMQYVRGSMLS